MPLALDVTDEAQARHVAGAALDRFGRIDVLVNNAGYGLLGAVEEATADEVLRLYDTNVFGLLHVTRAVLPATRARRAGHVVNISSLGGVQSAAGFGLYCPPSSRSRASPRRCTPSWRRWASTPPWWTLPESDVFILNDMLHYMSYEHQRTCSDAWSGCVCWKES